MSMFGTKTNGRLSATQKSLFGSVVGFTWQTKHALAEHAMAIIAHSTLCTSDLPIQCCLWILQFVSRSLVNANANDNNKKGIVKKLWLFTRDFVCHVSGMAAAFTLLFGMIWRETVLSSRTDIYFQSSG